MEGQNPFGAILDVCLRNTPWRDLGELRAAVDERNVNHVQSLYPGASVKLEDLRGFGRDTAVYERPAFSQARHQDSLCRGANCGMCPVNGNLVDVLPKDEDGRRTYYVWFSGKCPKWLRIKTANAPKEEARANTGFGFGE